MFGWHHSNLKSNFHDSKECSLLKPSMLLSWKIHPKKLRHMGTLETENLRRISIVFSASFLKFLCIPTIAVYLIFWISGVKLFSSVSLSSVHLPSSANPAITKCLIWLNCGLQETRNMSLVIPFSNIVLPVIPLLQRAKNIHETLV